jgi:hypothetical protein
MKMYKLILLLFSAWLLTPKYGFSVGFDDIKAKTIVKEIPTNQTNNLTIDVADLNLENDDDNDIFSKKNTLQIASILQFYVFGFNIYNQTKACPIGYYDTVKSKMVSTYILVNNFRI